MAPAVTIGIISTLHVQGGALAFKVCFWGRICKDLGVAGTSGAGEESAGVSILSIGRSHSLYTDGEFKPIPVVYSWLLWLLLSQGWLEKVTHTHPHPPDIKGENWYKNDISFFQKGLRNILAELLST